MALSMSFKATHFPLIRLQMIKSLWEELSCLRKGTYHHEFADTCTLQVAVRRENGSFQIRNIALPARLWVPEHLGED